MHFEEHWPAIEHRPSAEHLKTGKSRRGSADSAGWTKAVPTTTSLDDGPGWDQDY